MFKEYPLRTNLEDGVFIAYYRNILLRNVAFCEINNAEDLVMYPINKQVYSKST